MGLLLLAGFVDAAFGSEPLSRSETALRERCLLVLMLHSGSRLAVGCHAVEQAPSSSMPEPQYLQHVTWQCSRVAGLAVW